MPNIYLGELETQIDQFAANGLIIPVNRSQLTQMLYKALFRNPAHVLGDLVRKPESTHDLELKYCFNCGDQMTTPQHQEAIAYCAKCRPQPEHA